MTKQTHTLDRYGCSPTAHVCVVVGAELVGLGFSILMANAGKLSCGNGNAYGCRL